ncbi:ATJ72 [Scenedesmus sp. PABB004]|nr:ATJ72 [Scenedesmus sp. PABB004]
MRDPWAELGVARGAEEAEVKAAYRKLVLRWHPDRHASSSAAEQETAAARFKVVTQAYGILTDDRARAAYEAGPSGRGTYSHSGVNTDWARSEHGAGGGGYTSRLSRWEWYRRMAAQGLRGFGHSLHLSLAVLLVGGGLAFEYSHTAVWQARNKGKTFEDMHSAVREQREKRAAGAGGQGGGSSGGSSGGGGSGSSGGGGGGGGQAASESGDRSWHLHSSWADGMRGRFLTAREAAEEGEPLAGPPGGGG